MGWEWRLGVAAFTVILCSACATKRFIRGQVSDVNQKVDVLSSTTEETQERVRKNEERIADVDAKVASAHAVVAEAHAALAAVEASVAATRQAMVTLEDELAASRHSQKPIVAPRSTGLTPSPRPAGEQSVADAFGPTLGAIETYQEQLVAGHAGLSAPEKMTVGQSGDVVLLVSAKRAAEDLTVALQQLSDAGSVRVVEPAQLSKSMKARLTGPDFDVSAVNSEEQTGVLEDNVSWKWEVRPRKPGKLRLTATVTAVLRVDGRDTTKDEKVFSKEIVVEAAPAAPRTWQDMAIDWWSEYKPPPGFLWGTVLTGCVTWLWGWWTKRRSARTNDQPSTGFE